MSEYILGIDLGTSTTSAAIVIDGIAQTIPIEGESNCIMPSVVSFLDKGKRILIGSAAKKEKYYAPTTTVYSVKRIIGRKYSQSDTKKYAAKFPYKIVEGPNDSVVIDVFGKMLTPQDVSGFILKRVRDAAKAYTGQDVRKAVITVPANFNEAQRRATQTAGKLAGLEVLRIINEPTAAALAYGFGNSLNQKIAVYDFGGGTFDITILEVKDNFFEVLSTDGDSFLGGDDIDHALLQFFLVDIETNHGVKIEYNNEIYSKLTAEAEKLKIELSIVDSVSMTVKNIIPDGKDASGAEKRKDYELTITREIFEEIVHPIIDQSFIICKNALHNAHLVSKDVDAVVLVGGTTKIPYVQKMVSEFFGKDPFLGIETELVISMGASILGQSLVLDYKDESPVLLDVIPLALGVGTVGDYIEILVDKNEPLPIERTNIFTNAVDNQNSVKIQIYQGDGRRKSESHLMGELMLTELRPAMRGQVKIEVNFEIDTNGVLNVRAVDLETGKAQKIELNILGLG